MRGAGPPRVWRIGVETAIAILGLSLLAGALAANQNWFDRHFLPVFFLSRDDYVLGETLARLFVAGLGLVLLFARPWAGRLAARLGPRGFVLGALRIVLPMVLALGASELLLRRTFALAAAEGPAGEEPLRQRDARLGWTFVPARAGHAVVGGRAIVYSIDPHGYRVPSRDRPVDFARPAILFTGESIVAGFGLNWDESIPGQVETLLKMQSADMAVFGYANDQAYLRLADELPHFRKPVAVVSLFIPSLFVRNLDDDRPHLGPDLSWHPGVSRWRLHALANFLFPYHSEADIARGIQATRAVLRATAVLARKYHAVPLVINPQFGPEGPVEQMLRKTILDESGIAYVQVRLDPGWRLPGDLHPDPRAARAIAAAVAAHLRAAP